MFANHLSREVLGAELGVSAQAVGRWINDKRAPPKPTMSLIASMIGIPVEELTNRDLTLELIKRARGIQEDVGVGEPATDYGFSTKTKVLLHLEMVQERLKALLDDNRKMIDVIKTVSNGV